MHYFDHCASSPPQEEVIRTMAEIMAKHYANPSSLHRSGQEARNLLERARLVIAGLFPGTAAADWLFTSGGTESNNMAIAGAARSLGRRGKHLITSAIEHPSVYDTCKSLEREGWTVTYLPANEAGSVSADDVEEALTAQTALVSIMHVNNETGTIQPVGEIGRRLKERGNVLFHVDGVQSIGKVKVDLEECRIDLFSASAHKVGGPRGAGLLYVRSGLQLAPVYRGGGQERNLRPGTENVPAIVAAAKAFRLAVESQAERADRMYALRERLLACISAIPELVLNGSPDVAAGGQAAPNIVNFSYPGMKPEVIVHMLEKHQILASTKSACSSKSDEPSRVLLAMGLPRDRAASGIRISFGDEHGEAELEWLCGMLRKVVHKLKPLERKEG
ncbi:cysteine desulfurase family protein [Paenibacillus sacheonensis]|uniref:Aminotransferase class V-fold PLP-dependent enzyme n=1 Tax=Paenibacillus sacheonensis TaxID=742054 RepID=A0A7X5C3D7_9BACL|nr:cysteine desulfurase family protein [Paenibacillus sacheonensis]MBM7565672.1 cysteine desulfurase [Paenibacillus sacheonensis]NBC72270.1 aminotransferase class V-fold PLP-dependent enzyme [Paenibacillus sacheonensis]